MLSVEWEYKDAEFVLAGTRQPSSEVSFGDPVFAPTKEEAICRYNSGQPFGEVQLSRTESNKWLEFRASDESLIIAFRNSFGVIGIDSLENSSRKYLTSLRKLSTIVDKEIDHD